MTTARLATLRLLRIETASKVKGSALGLFMVSSTDEHAVCSEQGTRFIFTVPQTSHASKRNRLLSARCGRWVLHRCRDTENPVPAPALGRRWAHASQHMLFKWEFWTKERKLSNSFPTLNTVALILLINFSRGLKGGGWENVASSHFHRPAGLGFLFELKLFPLKHRLH